MTEYTTLHKEKLEKTLKSKGYTIVKLETHVDEGEGEESQIKLNYILHDSIASKADRASYGYFMWEVLVIRDEYGNKLADLLGDNVNVDDKEISRINQNNLCSPWFKTNSNEILLASNLSEWLSYNNINYSDCLNVRKVYDRLKFKKVGTPVFDKDGKLEGISSETLVISEEEIEAGLNEITNRQLVEKLKRIIRGYGEVTRAIIK